MRILCNSWWRKLPGSLIWFGAVAGLASVGSSGFAGTVNIATANDQALRYSITDLGAGIYPKDINDAGAIVGTISAQGGAVDFVRIDAGAKRVTLSAQGEQPYSIQINNANQIVGATTAGEGREYHVTPFRLDASGQPVPFVQGQMVAFINGLNDRGEVAARTWAGAIPYAWDNRAMIVRADGTSRLIDTLGGRNNEALAINNGGVIVGSSELSDQSTHGFYTDAAGRPVDLGTLGGSSSVAADINDSNVIVGSSANSAGNTHAFVKWPGEPMIDLTPEAHSSAATRINARGEILVTVESVQFIYEDNLLLPLGDLIQQGGTEWDPFSFAAEAINDRGQIVGVGMMGGGEHGFLLTPATGDAIPLPAPVLGGFLGIMLVCCANIGRALRNPRMDLAFLSGGSNALSGGQ